MSAVAYPTIVLAEPAAKPLLRGHPWAFRNGIVTPPALAAGSIVRAVSKAGELCGVGLYDPNSPIAFRRWAAAGRVDAELIALRLKRAFLLRERIASEGSTAYRLLHGEADRTPGWVIDRYGDFAVIKLDGTAASVWFADHAALVVELLRAIGCLHVLLRQGRDADGADTSSNSAARAATPGVKVEALLGSVLPNAPVAVREYDVAYYADLLHGQKTGAFLDQRENRRRVGAITHGKSVLNLFSYAGGFSLHAARGGAVKVTSVDIAPKAHVTAQRSFELAGVAARGHEFVAADAFAYLESAAKAGRKWDVVVCDPPSFAPSEAAVPRALAAYRKLHTACVSVLARDGVFCAASCSSHVPASAFLSTLDDSALKRDDLRLLELFGAPPDHPTLPMFPEGAYLKFAVLA